MNCNLIIILSNIRMYVNTASDLMICRSCHPSSIQSGCYPKYSLVLRLVSSCACRHLQTPARKIFPVLPIMVDFYSRKVVSTIKAKKIETCVFPWIQHLLSLIWIFHYQLLPQGRSKNTETVGDWGFSAWI